MNWTLISTVIGVLTGLLGILREINNMRKAQEEAVKAQAVRDKEVDDRLAQIEKKLDDHNSYAEKFSTITSSLVEMQTDLRWIKESVAK